MLVSMVVFFGYEIIKTIRQTWYLGNEYQKIPADISPEAASARFVEMLQRGRTADESNIRATKQQAILSLVPAAIAILMLGGGFAWYLILLVSPHIQALWRAVFP